MLYYFIITGLTMHYVAMVSQQQVRGEVMFEMKMIAT